MTQFVMTMTASPRDSKTLSRGLPTSPILPIAIPRTTENITIPSTLEPSANSPSTLHVLKSSGQIEVWCSIIFYVLSLNNLYFSSLLCALQPFFTKYSQRYNIKPFLLISLCYFYILEIGVFPIAGIGRDNAAEIKIVASISKVCATY